MTSATANGHSIKLNIGAGSSSIPGFTAVDRKLGLEAYPLAYADNSVDEIRASHVLEHFSFGDAMKALHDWVRVLKPGGRIRIAVPDFDKCVNSSDPDRVFFMMGGQQDEDDFHRSAYDRKRLSDYMENAGLVNIKEWQTDGLDTSSHRVSLNLQGRKQDNITSVPSPDDSTMQDVKIAAYMTLPRYEAVAARSIAENALRKMGIGLATSQGVFWGQCMQRMFTDAIEQGVDWILSIDSDSLFNEQHLSALFDEFAKHPEADAMAALQCRRGKKFPLMTVEGSTGVTVGTLSPIKATTAHFGLTLIRVDALKQVPKPWFFTQPDPDGDYNDGRMDDDIWFWHVWKEAGKTVYVAPSVSIGHLEEMVAMFDENLQPQHKYVTEWRDQNLNLRQRSGS